MPHTLTPMHGAWTVGASLATRALARPADHWRATADRSTRRTKALADVSRGSTQARGRALRSIVLSGVALALVLTPPTAWAGRYYVFQLDHDAAAVVDLGKITRQGSSAFEESLATTKTSDTEAQPGYSTRATEFDCNTGNYRDAFEGALNADGTLIKRIPLPMASFRPAPWVYDGLRLVDVVCGRTSAPSTRIIEVDLPALGDRLRQLMQAASTQAQATAPKPPDPWTSCMTFDTPVEAKIAACTATLKQRDLSSFHRSLLTSARGEAYRSLGRYPEAIADFTAALRLNPRGGEDTLVRRGIAYEQNGKPEQALRDYDRAIRDHATDPANRTNGSQDVDAEEHALRGRVLLQLGRSDAAYRELTTAIAKSPGPTLAVRDYDGGVGAEVVRLQAAARLHMKTRP